MDSMIDDAGLSEFVKVYIDDILIHTTTLEEHLSVLTRVFAMFKANGLKLHPGKSIFCSTQVDFLGHTLSRTGKNPSAAKVAAIRDLPTPIDVHSLRRLLGFCSFYREYTPRFTELAFSLYQLLQKDYKWEWTPERDKNWNELKDELCKEGNALRRADRSKPFILHTDWSHHGLSAILNQMGDDGKEYLVACTSRSCNKAESKYGSFRGELLAVVFGMRTFRYYLLGSPFSTTLYTDHKGLIWLMANKDLEGQYQRWQVILSAYDFVIKYKKGETHIVADVPSRFPMATTIDNTGSREPETVDRPIQVDMSDLSLEEKECALAEIAEFNAVAACTLLGKALSLNAPSAEQLVSNATYSYEQLVLDGFHMFDSATQLNLDMISQRAAQSTPCCSLAAHFDASIYSECLPDNFNFASDFQMEDCDFQRTENAASLLHSTAAHRVEDVRFGLNELKLLPTCNLCVLPVNDEKTDAWRHHLNGRITGINSHIAPEKCLQSAFLSGLTVVELFGGMASGLEACLRNGIPIKRYIYSDKSDAARAIAEYRLQGLSLQYPLLLPPEAWENAFNALPQDVYNITSDHLVAAGCLDGSQWFVIAGFECQDLSSAGSGKGLSGHRSNTFYPLLQIIGELQLLQVNLPPLYLIENTSMQSTPNVRPAVLESYFEICARIGQSCLLDAARMGSYAHRLRNYWTNIADSQSLSMVLDSYERDPTLALTDILEFSRNPQICRSTHPDPWYPANVVDEPLRVLPTLVATIDSYSFRDNKVGMVIDQYNSVVPLTIEERELALGFHAGCTAAPGALYDIRHKVTGSAFDVNALSTLMAAALAIRSRNTLPYFCSAQVSELGGGESISPSPPTEIYPDDLADLFKDGQEFIHFAALSAYADGQEIAEGQEISPPVADIWDDTELLKYIQGDKTVTPSDRIRKRSSRFRWTADKLYRVMSDGTLREVPPLADRFNLIRSLHESTGHWGRRRTAYLAMKTYWFPNLYKVVRTTVQSCPACSRQQAVFNSTQPTLNSVPMKGFMYRWGMDTAGPFTVSGRGNTYFLVCIEHFSKYIEAFPLKDKSSDEIAYHFLHGVLSRYGACAEVLTDGGGEFQGAFAELLVKAMIDHRVTSRSHPQANGLAERCVKSIKACVQRIVDSSGLTKLWDEYIPWILMGYRATPQEATKVSPYRVLFGCDPVIPPSIMERMTEPLSFDDPEQVSSSILLRAKACEDATIIAGRNILIAQHRDQLRYARLRSGGYLASIANFTVGQFVYVKDSADALHSTARPEILRVQEVRPSGVLVLVGKDGQTMASNAINCAPCHLPIHIPVITPLLDQPLPNHFCESCKLISDEHVMLLCDSCSRGWHTYCLQPPLDSVPAGDWLCHECIRAGVKLDTLRTQRADFQNIRDTRTAKRHGRLENAAAKKDSILPVAVPQVRVPNQGPDPAKARRHRSLASLSTNLYSNSLSWCSGFLQQLMPGEWSQIKLDQMESSLFNVPIDQIQSDATATQILTLLSELDLSFSPSVVDCTYGHSPIQELIRQCNPNHLHITGEHSIFYPCDLASPRAHQFLTRRHGNNVIITSPCLELADIIIPLTSAFASHVACFCLPVLFLQEVFDPRSAWLSSMHAAQRLHLISLPLAAGQEPFFWLLVFKSSAAKRFMLHASAWDIQVSSLLSTYSE